MARRFASIGVSVHGTLRSRWIARAATVTHVLAARAVPTPPKYDERAYVRGRRHRDAPAQVRLAGSGPSHEDRCRAHDVSVVAGLRGVPSWKRRQLIFRLMLRSSRHGIECRRVSAMSDEASAARPGDAEGRPITVHGVRHDLSRVGECVPAASEDGEIALAHEESDTTFPIQK